MYAYVIKLARFEPQPEGERERDCKCEWMKWEPFICGYMSCLSARTPLHFSLFHSGFLLTLLFTFVKLLTTILNMVHNIFTIAYPILATVCVLFIVFIFKKKPRSKSWLLISTLGIVHPFSENFTFQSHQYYVHA